MLDTGASVSVMSAQAWQELGAPTLRPLEVTIRMADDQPIKVLGINEEVFPDLGHG